MKKKFIFFLLLLGVFNTSLLAKTEIKKNKKVTKKVAKKPTKKVEYNIEDFKNDLLTIQLQQEVNTFFSIIKNNQLGAENIAIVNSAIQTRSKLNEKYGTMNVSNFIDELANDLTLSGGDVPEGNATGKEDGDNCHRNSDGTVYDKNCNAWETLKVFFKVLADCPSMSTTYPPPSKEQVDEYQKCVQEKICKTC